MGWSKGLAYWTENNTAYVSVAFSWKVPEAVRIATYYRNRGFDVRVGGTILDIAQNSKPFDGIAEIGGNVDALVHHNPDATMASRGCPVGCWFCIVPKVEGKAFTLLPDFTPRPILCDNNLSALPVDYQNHIIQKYKDTDTPLLDANSGFEPSSFDEDTFHRWATINRGVWRFAFDEMKEAKDVERMAMILKDLSPRKKQVYVLVGNEPMDVCYERVIKTIEWGCEPYCQAVLPLNTLDRRQYLIRHDWTRQALTDFVRWVNALHCRIQISEYVPRVDGKKVFANSFL